MGQRVFITKDALEGAKSCGDHTGSPEWTGEGLDYKDFEQTMVRLAKTSKGRGRLMWLAKARLIPRSEEQIQAFLEETPCEVFERAERKPEGKKFPPIPAGEHPYLNKRAEPPAEAAEEAHVE